jgi:enoyl-CoA hydratase
VTPFVELILEGSLVRLTLKRADKLNALDRAMIDARADAARTIDASSETQVAILSGEGNAFCAGGDIAAWGAMPALEMWRDWTRTGHRAFEALARLRVPLIAALTGHAFGGGPELAAVADIRIAESGIKLGLPESGLGMAPGWSAIQRLVRRFGSAVVRRMALGGAMFTAEEGAAIGLVDEVTPKGDGIARADAVAADIAKRGPLRCTAIGVGRAVRAGTIWINSFMDGGRSGDIGSLVSAATRPKASQRLHRRKDVPPSHRPSGELVAPVRSTADLENREPFSGFWIRRRTVFRRKKRTGRGRQ